MESSVAAIIAASADLLGSALTGLITYFIARREQRGTDVDELRAALAGFGAVVDRVGRHLGQMPHPPGPAGRLMNRLVSRWRDLDWAMGRLSTATLELARSPLSSNALNSVTRSGKPMARGT